MTARGLRLRAWLYAAAAVLLGVVMLVGSYCTGGGAS